MSGPRPQHPRAGPSATGVIPSIQRCHGPCRPGPRRPSVPTGCRSLPAAGSLGSPVRCTVKARQSSRADATDRLRGHAPLASLVPRHWWFETLGLEHAAWSSTSSTASPALPTRPRDSKPPTPTIYPRPGVGADGSGVPRSGDGIGYKNIPLLGSSFAAAGSPDQVSGRDSFFCAGCANFIC